MAFSGTLIRSGNNAKTIKGDDEYETAIMYLAPYKLAGINVCPMAEQAGCVAGCLNTAGRGAFNNVQQARINKTKRYLASRSLFMAELANDIGKFVNYCKRKGVKPAVRLNGTSDIQWEVAHPVKYDLTSERYVPSHRWYGQDDLASFSRSIFELFPDVQFYDYTKVYKRVYRDLPANYTLVLSYSAANEGYAKEVIQAATYTGTNVAVVYRTKGTRDGLVKAPTASGIYVRWTQLTRPVIDGDETDMRFLDPKGVIVGLYAKGRARTDTSGFVIG